MSENTVIKAIAYDVDGTMVDSEPLHVAAWQETLQGFDREFTQLPLEFQSSMAGRKPIAIATFMVETLSIPATPEEFLGDKHSLFLEKVKTDLRPMPGVVESVKRLKQDYVLGIGTALSIDYIDIVLDVLGVREDFTAVVTGDRISRGKPDPETYLVVAEELGVNPSEMVVLEDAKSGVESAKAAGSLCIAIENPNGVRQDLARADAVVGSLDEVTTDFIRKITF